MREGRTTFIQTICNNQNQFYKFARWSRGPSLPLELSPDQLRVRTVPSLHQLIMRPNLNDPPIHQNTNAIRPAHGAEPVSNHHGGSVLTRGCKENTASY